LCTGEINQGGYLGAYDPTVQAINPLTNTMMATVLFDRNISNNGTLVLYAGGGLQNRLTGNISGTGNINIGCFPGYEYGSIVLSGDNTFTGDMTVNSGTLMLEGDNRLASTSAVYISSYGNLYLDGDQVLGNFVCGGTLNMKDSLLAVGSSPTDSNSMSGYMTGSGMFSVNNGSTLSMYGLDGSQYYGDFYCGTGSTLAISSNSTLSTGSVITLDGGALQLDGDIVVGYLENNGGTITGGTVTNALTLVESGTVTSTITDGENYEAGILKQGETTATVNATQEFTGVVKVQEGTLALGSNGSFDANASAITYDGATLDLNDQSQTLSAINGSGGSIDLGTGTLTVNSSTSNSTYGGSIVGSGQVVKDGSETLTLTGGNTYSGNTTVTEGTFLVNGSANNTTVIVQSGAIAGGSGSVGGLIIESGGTVAPSGSMEVVGNTSWNAGGNYDWSTTTANTDEAVQTAAGSAWDLIDGGGTLTLSGAAPGAFNLNLTSLTGGTTSGVPADWNPAVGSTWLIASATGGIFFDTTLVSANSNYTSFFNINATNWTASLPDLGWRVVTLGNTTDLYLQAIGSAAVPEPGQIAASILLLLGIGGYVLVKRRKAALAPAI
jgi:autotransporter-associated beta strand protein